jgi:hypothetical protein
MSLEKTLEKPSDPLDARLYELLLPHRRPSTLELENTDNLVFNMLYQNIVFLMRHQCTGGRPKPEDISVARHKTDTGGIETAVIVHGPEGAWPFVKVRVQEGSYVLLELLGVVNGLVEAAFREIGD